ncbi:MAG TPA: murein biosynthesis integral membrane protein MurJ [Fimbriimonadaceae bacterium]|jgi:putative peptidoglycan lipid II flippase
MAAVAEERESEQKQASVVRTAGSAGGIMVASLFLSRLLGLLRDTEIGSKFGLLGANDSYRIAIQIPDLIFMLIAGGGLSSAFIPVFTELWYTDRRKEAWKVFSSVVTICSIIAVALIAVAWFLAVPLTNHYGKDKPAVIPDALLMSRIMLPAQFAFLIGSILLGTLYARKQFLGPALAPNVYNVGIIAGAAVLPGIFGFGIIGVAWGALIGAFIGNIVIPIFLMAPQGGYFRFSLDVSHPGVKKFFQLLLPVIIGFSLPSMVSLVTQWFGSPYGTGSNTALAYSNNLMQAPLGIFGQSFALGAFPILSQLFAEKKMGSYRDLVSKTLRTTTYFAVPSAVIMFAMAPLIVKIIYGYGKAANEPGQLDVIADCLRIYCIAIPAWCLQPTLIRGFFSMQETLRPIALGTAMTLLFILECVGIQNTNFDLRAFPWATNIAALLLVVILFYALEKEIGKLDRPRIFVSFMKALVASIPAAVVGYFGMKLVPTQHKLIAALAFLLLFTVVGGIYFYATKMLGMSEAKTAIAKLQGRFSRKSA